MSVSLVPVDNDGLKLAIGACAHPQTSAGQPLLPPPTRRRSDRVIRVTKNAAVFDPAGVFDCYEDTINNLDIVLAYPRLWTVGRVFPAGSYVQDSNSNVFFTSTGGTSAGDDSDLAGGSDTGIIWVAGNSSCWPGQHRIRAKWGYMRSISGNPQTLEYETGAGVALLRYYEVTYEIVVRRGGWDKSDYLNKGTVRVATEDSPDGNGGTYSLADLAAGRARKAPILDADGNPVAEPVLLDESGQPYTGDDTLYYMRFCEFSKTDWSADALGLL